MKLFNFIRDYLSRTDKILWSITISISALSLALLLSVSRTSHFGYFKTQLIAILLGYAGAIFITKSSYRFVAKHWKIVAGICIGLILLTLFVGVAVTGNAGINAKAWLKLPGGITFQPSELAKIGFIITFSKHLAHLKTKNTLCCFQNVVLLGAHALVPVFLTHLQGDDGAAMIFFCMFLIMAFVAGVQLRYFVAIFAGLVLLVPILWNYVFAEYQKQRILSSFNPEASPLGTGFQQIQGKLSIGSGQIFGHGLFKGPRVEYGAVPIQESDFIFSAVGEELGFIGCVIILLLLICLLLRVVKTSFSSSDDLGTYICFGFFSMIAAQTIFNLGMCLCVLPVVGVTLPFLSAGGSSSACLYLGLGLVQSVYMHRTDKTLGSIPTPEAFEVL